MKIDPTKIRPATPRRIGGSHPPGSADFAAALHEETAAGGAHGTVGGSVGWSVDSIHLFLQVFARALGLEWRTTILNNDFAGTKGMLPFEI